MNSRLFTILMAMALLLAACSGSGGSAFAPAPAAKFTVGGNVTGLAGTVVLQNNAKDNLTVTKNGVFTFATGLATGVAYQVTVLTQPAGQLCTASTNIGTIAAANVTNVKIACVPIPKFTVGGNVTGLAGTVVLQNNARDNLTVTKNGAFTFATGLATGVAYQVTVLTQPAGQLCTASTNIGTIAAANVTNVAVACVAIASTGSSSGSIGVFTKAGATFAVTPGGAAAAGTAKLISLPNTGTMVAAPITKVTATLISTSLTTVNGTTLDAAHDIGMAFAYNSSIISIFKLSTATEITTYNSGTINTMSFSGALPLISGAIMDPSRQWIILSTGDGYDIVDYSTPTAPVRVRLIASTATAIAPVVGVTMMENFGYDPAIPNAGTPFPALFASGGSFPIVPTQIVDATNGKVYGPDAATTAITAPQVSYIDSAAVDTVYHVALLAEESSSQQHLIDLNQVTFNATTGTYNIPAAGYLALTLAGRNSLGFKMTNIAIESGNHLIFAGRGFGGTTMSLAKLKDPAVAPVGPGIVNMITGFAMPTDVDNLGISVFWSGSRDPHGVGAYKTGAKHPVVPNTSLALWMNSANNHLAVINLQNVLTGVLAGGAYNPITTVPKDIAYFSIP